MASIEALRERSTQLFTDLLAAQAEVPPRRRPTRALAAGAPAPGAAFSWFDRRDAVRATTLTFRLAALSASRARVNDALERVLDHVAESVTSEPPELVRQGFAMFVIHNRDGRRLAKPRTVTAAPELFRPPVRRQQPGRQPRLAIGGAAPQLDYWREDALANDHHQHWHEVYPYTGLPPRDFRVWAEDTPRADMVAVLDALAPGEDWANRLVSATPSQIANLFAQVVVADGVDDLPADLYRVLFHLNDRQGELFFYMHQQMLARYDAELVSNGLSRVIAYGPTQWPSVIPEGHDPVDLPSWGRRDPDERLLDDAVMRLRARQLEIDDALRDGVLRGPGGTQVRIDRTTLGEAVEAVVPQLRSLAPDAYLGLHNPGHVGLADLSKPRPRGVMISTISAIRDQVFWRWHKHVDDLSARWQDGQAPYAFDDGPDVLVRNAIDPTTTTPWASPDLILCRTDDLPDVNDLDALAEEMFGGDRWSEDFSAGAAVAAGVSVPTIDELTTSMGSVLFNQRRVAFLRHDPYTYFVRVENRASTEQQVTVRAFLAPSSQAHDRRAWIEMDKFMLVLPPQAKVVAARRDSDASVIKRAVDQDPLRALAGQSTPDEDSYCDCGWPYPLQLPRGSTAGMRFRFLAMCTDGAIDRVPEQGHCGSMSYCGAVDRYPDTRDMGYPFARPFEGARATAIRDMIVGRPNAAARSVIIRHV